MTPNLPALDRLKNYDAGDINLDMFDGFLSQTHKPESLSQLDDMAEDTYDTESESEESDLFKRHIDGFNCDTPACDEELFAKSIFDSDLPDAALSSTKSREIFKQAFEESCELADSMGEEARKELEECFRAFKSFCNEKSNEISGGAVLPGRVVPMTSARYEGSADRVHNTHHMYRSK